MPSSPKTQAGSPLREEQRESIWEAAPAVVFVIGGQLLLTLVSWERGWRLWHFGWWIWLVPTGPELALLAPLVLHRPRQALEQLGLRRAFVLLLIGFITVANAFLVLSLVIALVNGDERSGGQLLLKALTVWGTNVIAFGLWYWAFDRGGPVRRRQPAPGPRDFQFPQDENPKLAAPGWHPELLDYIYVSFTNSIAFSPTDAMPLTRRAKLLMLAESGVSALTVLLATARAVNIIK